MYKPHTRYIYISKYVAGWEEPTPGAANQLTVGIVSLLDLHLQVQSNWPWEDVNLQQVLLQAMMTPKTTPKTHRTTGEKLQPARDVSNFMRRIGCNALGTESYFQSTSRDHTMRNVWASSEMSILLGNNSQPLLIGVGTLVLLKWRYMSPALYTTFLPSEQYEPCSNTHRGGEVNLTALGEVSKRTNPKSDCTHAQLVSKTPAAFEE